MIGSIDHFVNQQILRWQEERRIAERKRGKVAAQQPTICISRSTARAAPRWVAWWRSGSASGYYAQELIHDIAEAAARAAAGGGVARRAGAGRHLGVGRRTSSSAACSPRATTCATCRRWC